MVYFISIRFAHVNYGCFYYYYYDFYFLFRASFSPG